MDIFYKASQKESREERNKIFLEKGLPALKKHGFKKSPFSSSWFGKDEHGGYSYELCRLTNESELQVIEIYICLRDQWIQEHINIFSLVPQCQSIENLAGIDGLQFHLPPNSRTKMRLEPPKGLIFAGMPQHKIRLYLTKNGFRKRLTQLAKILEIDLSNIQHYISRWHASNVVLKTNWEGHEISFNNNNNRA